MRRGIWGYFVCLFLRWEKYICILNKDDSSEVKIYDMEKRG